LSAEHRPIRAQNGVSPDARSILHGQGGSMPAPESVMPQSKSDTDLAWAMGFEHRKEEATRHRHGELRAAQDASQSHASTRNRSSPHKNRYNAAIANLEAHQNLSHDYNVGQEKEPFKTSLPDGDPRIYLMRRQKSLSVHTDTLGGLPKLKRVKTMLLPLEMIPESAMIHDLIKTVPTDTKGVRTAMAALVKYDVYVSRGTQAVGLDMSAAEASAIEKRFKEVVRLWMEPEMIAKYDFNLNFSKLLDTKMLGVA